MARAHYVAKARKDNKAVKAGQPYWWWQFYKGPVQYSATRPRQSQLTNSEKLSRAYAAGEQIEDIPGTLALPDSKDGLSDLIDDVKGTLESIVEEIRQIASEYEDSASNIRDSFAESPTADECEEKQQQLEEWADSIDTAIQEIESVDVDVSDDEIEESYNSLVDLIQGIDGCPI